MTEDESEVFEITDFTTASEWERFIARLEEIFHEWKLANVTSPQLKKGTTGSWEEVTEKLQFADFQFLLCRRTCRPPVPTETPPGDIKIDESKSEESQDKLLSHEGNTPAVWRDMMSIENDFPSRAHCLSRWYGLRDFIVLSPASPTDDIMTESRINLLLSSVTIALNNTSCQLPIFVQVHQRWRKLFLGRSEFPGFSTSFEMIHLKNIPQTYSHLAGLLDVFKAKLASPVAPHPPIMVTVRFTYLLQDWVHYGWPQAPPDIDAGGGIGFTDFGHLPFGAYDDPVSELLLSATWPNLHEEMIVDNNIYSDLDLLQAPHWSVRVRMTENPHCLLSDRLQEFVLLCHKTESTDQLLGKLILDTGQNDVDMGQALSRLTDLNHLPIPSLGNAVTSATSKLVMRPDVSAPINIALLNELLLFIFPDAKADMLKLTDSTNSLKGSQGTLGTSVLESDQSKETFKQFKSAPANSLTRRLAVSMCNVNHAYGGLRAVAHLWQEFVLEMRYRWENGYSIPDLDAGPPNMGCSLLHQKLQMLNCCIEHRKVHEQQTSASHNAHTDHNSVVDISSSSDEEFFDCLETSGEPKLLGRRLKRTSSFMSETESSKDESDRDQPMNTSTDAVDAPAEPEGRLRECTGRMLLNEPDVPIFIPVTQEPAPMTEDMLEEHAEVLAKLGTSAEGAHLRARMQSACLLSDMEAFKAANPRCVLADFVRWYSPRDWVEEEVDGHKKGQLSQRMQIPGNMWVEVWQNAKAVPCRRQRRLFDDTKEAEKVLHWLSSMKPADVALRLMPMVIHQAIHDISQHDECDELASLKSLLERITNKAANTMRAAKADCRQYEDLVQQLRMAETIIARAQSLHSKFSAEQPDGASSTADISHLVSSLIEQPEVEVIGAARGPVGCIIQGMFASAQKSAFTPPGEESPKAETDGASPVEFPAPMGREYILRTTASRPAPWSQPSPQRMYCVLMKDDFRLAGAFSSDTTFQ